MSLLGLLELLIISALCRAIGHMLVGESAVACLISSVVGLAGAALGGWLSGQVGLPTLWGINIGGRPFLILWSVAEGSL